MHRRPHRAAVSAAWAATLVPALTAAQPTDLFFSEYIEGSGFNKVLEIHNGTGASVDLSNYTIELFVNGSATAGASLALSGTLADGEVFVIAEDSADPAILAVADLAINAGVVNFNGDDAVRLSNNGMALDVIGQIGFDPGSEWGSGNASTADNTIRRMASVCAGDPDGSDAFDPALEWDGFANGTFDGLGAHAVSCTPAGPALAIDDVALAEGDSGTTEFVFTVTLSGDPGAFTVDYATGAGGDTAAAGSDYAAATGTLNFAGTDGQTHTVAIEVTGDTDPESDESFSVVLSNVQGAVVTLADDTGTGTILNDDLTAIEVFEIQGSGAASAFDGQSVLTEGNIVTVLGPDGFAMQTPDARADGVRATSDGIFVFTGAAPTCEDGGTPRALQVGDEVRVQGTVDEFFGLTEVTGNPAVACTGSGLALPTAVVFATDPVDGDVPSRDPSALFCGDIGGQQNNFECLEGMRVSIPDGIVTRGNQRFSGDDYAQVHIGPHGTRSLREAGVRFGSTTDAGNAAAGVWDGNPEILEMDADRLGAVPTGTELVAGARFSATGILGYSFSDYEFWPGTLDLDAATNVLPRPVRARADDAELSVASFNVLRLCNTLDDEPNPSFTCDGGGGGPGGEPTQAELDDKLLRLGDYIVHVLNLPDVLGVQEVETLAVLQDLATRIQADSGVAYAAYLSEGNDGGGIDNGFLVREDRIDVVSVTQLRADETWFDPASAPDPDLLHDRPPLLLVAEFATPAGGRPLRFAVMNNHTKSRSGVDTANTSGQRNRAKRYHQALSIAAEVQAFQGDPSNAAVPLILVGDYNAYQFSDGYVDLVGLVSGRYEDDANGCAATLGDGTPEDCDLGGANPVTTPLTNMVDVIASIDSDEAYSFLFTENFGNIQGQARDVPTSQVLDHILVSTSMEPLLVDAAFGRANTDASLQGADTGTAPDGSGGTHTAPAVGSSDHDGLAAFIDTDCSANAAGDEDADGICTLVDNCTGVFNPGQDDADGDSIGDACDAPPVIGLVPDQATDEDVAKVVGFTINDADDALDCTADVSATSDDGVLLPPAAFSLGGTAPDCTVTVTAAADRSGAATVTLELSDGTTTVQVDFVLTVSPVNDAPVADGSAPDVLAAEGEAVELAMAGYFDDIDGDVLTYAADGLPTGLSIDPGTGLISGSPQFGTSTGSPYLVTVTASDPDGAGATQQFDIAILSAGPADGPVFTDGFED